MHTDAPDAFAAFSKKSSAGWPLAFGNRPLVLFASAFWALASSFAFGFFCWFGFGVGFVFVFGSCFNFAFGYGLRPSVFSVGL